MTAAVERIGQLPTYEVSELDLSGLRPARITALARHATTARPETWPGSCLDRRIAVLLAFAVVTKPRATDDALDLFCELLQGLIARVERRGLVRSAKSSSPLPTAA